MTQSPKSQKQKPKNQDKKQSERFIETARELEADESGEEFERAIDGIMPTVRRPDPSAKQPS